ncbi:bolA-like protein DDB_G0274169 isoform X2 [Macrobrachium rosenbergii]|uniref:bolA-like protein DDB_G0274169 isoform X2 n=1 Tax=Macrobrachium rosenbergii TaxID=79674 RepID=UPI0034D72934
MARPLLASSLTHYWRASAFIHSHRGSTARVMVSVGPVELSIKNKIESALKPSYLEIINESYMHNVPPQSETHFKVVVVSEAFSNVPLIKRHRLVNEVLSEELSSQVHALSIVAKTPTQWEEGTKEIEKSPACRGGFGK